MDATCSDYNRLCKTNSLRGILDFEINIQSLDNDCNYGPEISGRIAENYFLIRKILDGVIDTTTGEVKINEFQVNEIPKINNRRTNGKRNINFGWYIFWN